MITKIKKVASYIINYRQNRDLLRTLHETDTFPLLYEFYKVCLRHSNVKTESEEQILSRILISIHSIEKGLANREMRYGFGQAKIQAIIRLCNIYLDRFEKEPFRLRYAIEVLREYKLIHDNVGFSLSEETQQLLLELFERFSKKASISETKQANNEEYFAYASSDFKLFSLSRHSCRDFTGAVVQKELVMNALSLAQQSPSACNRQSTRVYCIYDETKRKRLVELQNHERGFADNACPLLVIAFETQDWGTGEEWFGGFLDSGIYLMNLLYSLHYYKIAAIPLNWYANLEDNQEIHRLLNIPESQVVVALVACGEPEDSFKIVTSKRVPFQDIVSFIES